MGGKSQPAPDYTGAAEEGRAGRAAKTSLCRRGRTAHNSNTPWGSQTWGATGGYDLLRHAGYAVDLQHQPDAGAAIGARCAAAAQQGRSGAAETLLGQATGSFQTPFNWGALPQLAGTPQARQMSAGAPARRESHRAADRPAAIRRQTSIPQYGQQTGVQQYGLDTSAPGQTTFAGNEPGFAGERQRIEQALA